MKYLLSCEGFGGGGNGTGFATATSGGSNYFKSIISNISSVMTEQLYN
jgi:hypothetical protein